MAFTARIRMAILPIPWIWRGCWDWTAARTCWALAFGVYRPPRRASRLAEHVQAVEDAQAKSVIRRHGE